MTFFSVRNEELLEQYVTIYEFVWLWFGYCKLSKISEIRTLEFHHERLLSSFVPKTHEQMNKLRKEKEKQEFITKHGAISPLNPFTPSPDVYWTIGKSKFIESPQHTLIRLLMADKALKEFPETSGINNLIVDSDFNSYSEYKILDLMNWTLKKYDTPNVWTPEWAIEAKKEVSVKEGYVDISTLPKLLQLAISAHQHFDWNQVELISQKNKSDFKKDAIKYLNKEAIALKIPHSDNNKSTELGISTTTLNTFIMAIKPDDQ